MAEPFAVLDYDWRTAWLQVVWRHRGLTAGAKLTASALADHLNIETKQLNPATVTLADETGQSIRAAKKGIDALRATWLLSWLPGSGRTSSFYTLVLPIEGGTVVPGCPEHTCEAVRHILKRRAEQKRRKGGTSVPPNLVEPRKNLGATPARGPAGAPAVPVVGLIAEVFEAVGKDKWKEWHWKGVEEAPPRDLVWRNHLAWDRATTELGKTFEALKITARCTT